MEQQILRLMLATYLVAAFIASIKYLRYRGCSTLEFTLWATLAFSLPILGPFFVIAARPGPKKRTQRIARNNPASTPPERIK